MRPVNRCIVPAPNEHGAIANSLKGKILVLTGLFPEVGGGTGLNIGKDRVKAMVESFGGRVTSAVSGTIDVLIVGPILIIFLRFTCFTRVFLQPVF